MRNEEPWICESCIHYPPSSLGGKPCCNCWPEDPLFNAYSKREPDATEELTEDDMG